MSKQTRKNNLTPKKRTYSQQEKDDLAVSLSEIFGARVVAKTDFDKLNKQNQKLLSKEKDITNLQIRLIKKHCKLEAFVNYHKKWKPTTREFTNRTKKLKDEKLLVDLTKFPSSVSTNLKEAYKCYINGLNMSAYIMILRTIEFIVGEAYHKSHPDNNFVPASKMLNWAKNEKIIGGADYIQAKSFIEARNQSVHEIYVPTEKQIMAAFETVILLLERTASK